MQDILEARVEFENNCITRITVLVRMSTLINDVRAIFATTKPRNGYMHILPSDALNNDLLQRVADHGLETMDRDSVFPHWRTKAGLK